MPSQTSYQCLAYYGVGCEVIQQVLWVLIMAFPLVFIVGSLPLDPDLSARPRP